MTAQKPLVVLADRTVLLETAAPGADEAREGLSAFAELEKSPEHVHTFRITQLSLWNAAAGGRSPDDVLRLLEAHARYGVPANVAAEVRATMARFGRLVLARDAGDAGALVLSADDALLIEEVARAKTVTPLVLRRDKTRLFIDPGMRGHVKKALLDLGFPVRDDAGYVEGERIPVALRETTLAGAPLRLRDYQREAVRAFERGGGADGGHGVVALPCGAGKTLVGIAAMAAVSASTLILCTSTTSVRQWIREILDKTTLTEEDVGEYTGAQKETRRVTVATYQVLTWQARGRRGEFPHLGLFRARNWGLVIYDEVHLLPAPVFRATAEIQTKRRLGLTATLVREDGLEGDVFSLVGPKRYDAPWKALERGGWIAPASCSEIRLSLPADAREFYALAPDAEKYGIAARNPVKLDAAEAIVRSHVGASILVIGQYLDQLRAAARRLGAPLVTGETSQRERDRLFERFRNGHERLLVVSRVANFSIDLPEASVAVQLSGTFGSRQEEAQRLGRVLRPKSDGRQAHFYSLVTRNTVDEDVNARRQLFLVEQGYRYEIADWETVEPALATLSLVRP
jgi:DNA excision repair protein ERCC-3